MNGYKLVRLAPSFREKEAWGTQDLEPWFPRSERKVGEVWFTSEPPLPILVKFLFTSDRLSVQVHPAGPQGKTEMWHILRAEPGASIALGFREPITRERLEQACRTGEIENLLRWFPVKAGDTFFTPAGTVHAIGAGIALCEIQQNNDVTYRLYDYNRPRELHLAQGLEVADLGVHAGASASTRISEDCILLAKCPYFQTELIQLSRPTDLALDSSRFHLLIFLEGQGRLVGSAFRAGEVWLVKESCPAFEISPDRAARLLRTGLPDS